MRNFATSPKEKGLEIFFLECYEVWSGENLPAGTRQEYKSESGKLNLLLSSLV